MDAGMAGARRSMQTAQGNEDRIRGEVEEHSRQITHWSDKAKEQLVAGAEDQARLALVRKREIEDLVAGLEQQLLAAEQTREHLATTFRALEARLAEARRRQQSSADGEEPADTDSGTGSSPAASSEIEDELAALKRELGQS